MSCKIQLVNLLTIQGLVQLARTSAEDWEAKFKEASQKLLIAQGVAFVLI